jgi:hypothetical protein
VLLLLLAGRVTAFVADITQHEGPGALSQQLPGPCADFCSMVFVLSAVAPHRMRQVRGPAPGTRGRGAYCFLLRSHAGTKQDAAGEGPHAACIRSASQSRGQAAG